MRIKKVCLAKLHFEQDSSILCRIIDASEIEFPISKLGVKMFGEKSGIRGTKIFGKRPVLAVMNDLVPDADSKWPHYAN